jgi:hypothetical protein
MADEKKFSQLTQIPAFDSEKIIAVQNDPAGTTDGWKAHIVTDTSSETNATLSTSKAIGDNFVHKTGNVTETIDGDKTFTGNVYGQQTTSGKVLEAGFSGQDGRIVVRDTNGAPFITFDVATNTYAFPGQRIQNVGDPVDAQDVATKNFVLNQIIEGVDEDNIVYAGKHGNNTTNDGKNISEAVLTCAKMLLNIFNYGPPSASAPYAARIFDGGVYEQSCSMTNVTYTHLIGEAATIKTDDGSINSNCSINVHEYTRYSGGGIVINKIGSGPAYIKTHKLYNGIATGGCIALNEGELYIDTDELTVVNRTDTLITTNPAIANKKLYIKAKKMRGKVFTTNTSDFLYIEVDDFDGDLSINAASIVYLKAKRWTGNIVSAGALSKVIIDVEERISNYLNDSYDSTATIRITENRSPYIHAYRSVNLSVGGSMSIKIGVDSLEGSAYGLALSGGGIRVDAAGMYTIEAGYALDPTSVGTSREIHIYINSSLVYKDTETQQAAAPAPSDKQNARISVIHYLNKSDLIELYIWQNNGTLTVHAGAAYKNQTYLKLYKSGN